MSEKSSVDDFIASFESLQKKKGGDKVFREARLLDIRFRLSLDLRIGIETKYSHTSCKSVRDCYERLFKFLDLWNVYEVCWSYAERLGLATGSKVKGWNKSFLKETGISDFLNGSAKKFQKLFVSDERKIQKYRQYLDHFSDLDAVNDRNQEQFKKYLAAPPSAFDYEQLLFIQYMERNAYYHGGEAARAGVDYGYRKKQFDFYIEFLTELIARMGETLFTKEMQKEEK